jgi:hypothetical protein
VVWFTVGWDAVCWNTGARLAGAEVEGCSTSDGVILQTGDWNVGLDGLDVAGLLKSLIDQTPFIVGWV